MSRWNVALCSLLFVMVPGTAACVSPPPEVPLGADGEPDRQLTLGRDVYSDRCATCHGTSGQGGTGPKLADGAVVDAYPVPAAQRQIIADGRNAMPSFAGRLSTAELDAVVRYTREVLSLP